MLQTAVAFNIQTQDFDTLPYEAQGIDLPPHYVTVIQQHWTRIQQIVALNKSFNPLFMHIYVSGFYHILSNRSFASYLDRPLSAIHIPILGLIAQENISINNHWKDLMSGNDTERHYKLWRFFFSAVVYSGNLCKIKDLVSFLMFCIDYAFYLADPFERDVLLLYLLNFIKTGLTYQFDFSQIFEKVKGDADTYFGGLLETLVAFEKLKLHHLTCHPRVGGDPFKSNGSTMDPRVREDDTIKPLDISSPIAAFLKIKTPLWHTFVTLLNQGEYTKAHQLCFN